MTNARAKGQEAKAFRIYVKTIEVVMDLEGSYARKAMSHWEKVQALMF